MSNAGSGNIEPLEFQSRQAMQGRYKVIASLGRGGMANIYLAVMLGPAGFSKLLVLKVLREDLDSNCEEFSTMFLDEARLAARLQHRNIVQTYDFGEISGRYHMAMEYLQGQPLRALQRKLLPEGIPVPDELNILVQTARGLHYAHDLAAFDGASLGVVHRDVSPQNIFVTYDGGVKLLDFGIAKNEDAEHLTRVGVIKGKVDYIAPEQIRGERVDRRADIFALGVMLWEAITKQRFAGGPRVADVTKFHKRLTGGERKVRELVPDVPEQLAEIVDRSIALAPDDRYATADEFADALESYIATLPERPSHKTLGALVTETFTQERAKLQQIIDARVQTIEETERRRSHSSSGARALDPSLTLSGMVDLSGPSSSLGLDLSITNSGASGSLNLGPTTGTASNVMSKSGRSQGKLAAIVAVAVAVAAGVGFGLRGSSSDAPRPVAAEDALAATSPQPAQPPAPASPVATVEAPTTKAPSAGTVRLRVEVSPAGAHVTLDGAPLQQLPFVGTFRKAGDMHHLEASADGFQTIRRLVTFDQDRDVVLFLRPEPESVVRKRPRRAVARPVAKAPAEPAEAPPAVVEPAPAPAPTRSEREDPAPGRDLAPKARRRSFDMIDPYAD